MSSLSTSPDTCAVVTEYTGHRGPGYNCDRPPTHRGIWGFEVPGPKQILLCDKHTAVLAGRERLTKVEPLGG